jgi:anthranilate synthase/aminodeoxychorismate synthase-like glutamine amidotransferase
MILVIDNYDSFTYNLVDYCGKLTNEEILVYRNDKITCEEINRLSPNKIIISPGPKTPSEAGISKEVIKTFAGKIPLLGVCLGHQAIGEVYGAKVIRAKNLMHGKTSLMSYTSHPLFDSLPNPFVATRYHSLVLDQNTIPDCLEVIAHSADDNEIMALVHKEHPLYGVQFHPESICTKGGLQIIKNFLDL